MNLNKYDIIKRPISTEKTTLQKEMLNLERIPSFLRDGTGGNEWLPVQNPQPGQAIPYEILPMEEMPEIMNPPYFINANNDPAGVSLDNDPLNQVRPSKPTAIYYLNPSFEIGMRAGRITRLVGDKIEAVGSLFEEEVTGKVVARAERAIRDADERIRRLRAAGEQFAAPGTQR